MAEWNKISTADVVNNQIEFETTKLGKYAVKDHNIRIPSAYQEVEWICNTGKTQYIDIPFSWNTNDYGFKITAELPLDTVGLAIAGYGTVMGVYSMIRNNQDCTMKYISEYWGVNTSLGDFSTMATASLINGTITMTDGTTKTINRTGLVSPSPYRIFDNTGYASGREQALVKLKELIIYNQSEPIYDLIACYRKSDTEIGLYDNIGNTFYTNSGTGTFTKGEDC